MEDTTKGLIGQLLHHLNSDWLSPVMDDTTKGLIFLTFGIYVFHLFVNKLAGGPKSKLFPNTVQDVSQSFELEITPAGKTFAIWGLIFLWQLGWMVYCMVNVFRDGGPATNILSNTFFLAFIANVLLITSWLFTWARKEAAMSFIIVFISQVILVFAIITAFCDFKEFMDVNKLPVGNVDVWLQRILVQNGLLFYGTWTTIATLLNLAIVLSYSIGFSTKIASLISISLLAVFTITWFFLENIVLLAYTKYTFAPYIVLIIATTGIWCNIREIDQLFGGLSFGLLALSSTFLVTRVVLIFYPFHWSIITSSEM